MGKIALLFCAYLIIEILILSYIITKIGFLNTLVCFLASMALGMFLVKKQKQQLLLKADNNIGMNLLYLSFIGFLFILPGFLSDLIGYLLLIPKVKLHCFEFFIKKLSSGAFRTFKFYNAHSNPYQGSRSSENQHNFFQDDNIVDVSYTDVEDDKLDCNNNKKNK